MDVDSERLKSAVYRPPDYVARAREFMKRHPHVSITFPRQNGTDEFIASWVNAGAAPDDEGPDDEGPDDEGIAEKVSHHLLESLMDYLEARFDRGSGQ